MMEAVCEASLVEPTMKQLRENDVQLTDAQMNFIAGKKSRSRFDQPVRDPAAFHEHEHRRTAELRRERCAVGKGRELHNLGSIRPDNIFDRCDLKL